MSRVDNRIEANRKKQTRKQDGREILEVFVRETFARISTCQKWTRQREPVPD